MEHINKPLALRTRLKLTQKQAGMLILRNQDEDDAQSVWQKIERENKVMDHMSNMVKAIFWHINWLIDDGQIETVKRMIGACGGVIYDNRKN